MLDGCWTEEGDVGHKRLDWMPCGLTKNGLAWLALAT